MPTNRMSDGDRGEIVIYQPPGGAATLDVRLSGETLWLTQAQIARTRRQPCPYSQAGRMPDVIPLDPGAPNYTVDKGQPGDLCPPCAKQQLASLHHWQGHGRQQFAEEILPLRLFKCGQWFWLVVPGLCDAEPTTLSNKGKEPQATA